MNEFWPILEQISLIVVGFAAGGPGLVWAINQIKGLLGIEGKAAWWLAAVASVLMAIFVGIAEGTLTESSFVLDNLAVTVLGLFAVAQSWYYLITGEQEPE